ncbi:MAG TPA: glucose-6-phosphate isomerase [Candidatus Goldiibacteriota bacterium]|nr:glucose-6-phosphate isomerase [Candidatus Goldiibacteriota bacterium]HPN64372.1 glucose-6-phosphate isomerase [Candidatus Goldiibacteriota bacterium]HRQ44571.1 glucose-6-phosphate isomerase [Candidatus Goldiibacteriota bacterium]
MTPKQKKPIKKARVKVDFCNMMSEKLGPEGITPAEINRLKAKIKQADRSLREKRDDGKLGFFYLPYDIKIKEEIKKAANAVREKFENFVVIGIGGAAPGTFALHRALKHPYYNLLPENKRKGPRFFMLDNPDPESACALFDLIDIKKTCVNIISKSGETAETAAFLKIFWKKFSLVMKEEKLKEHIVIITDRINGALRPLAERHGLMSFAVPDNVCGRFSVLSSAGLFPLAVCGVNIDELLKGAAYMDTMVSEASVWKNPAYMMAVLNYISSVKHKRNISVMMPYSDALKGVSDWHSQLWAESLGKKFSRDGRIVNAGLTPVKALGAADQYSQIQLYMEGPYDKVITFIKAEKFRQDMEIPSNFNDVESMEYLSGKKLGMLLNGQQAATQETLARGQRASMTITLPEISEFTIGQLIYLLEAETAFLGELYNINAFDRPGADAGKTAAFAAMGRKSHKDGQKAVKNLKSKNKYII